MSETEAFNQQVHDIWDDNAAFWDEKMGAAGNLTQRTLVGPAAERLLDLKPGETVLEIACGNGVFTRRMAELGARVVASDFAEKMLAHARARSAEYADRIEYRRIDATDESQILALGARRFDAAICNMAMMDMSAIEPLLSGLSQVLKPGGRFVFSVTHPCFNNVSSILMLEEEIRDGEPIVTYSVKVSRYLGFLPTKGVAIIGQPRKQYYFDRPLSVLFSTCFRAGFVMDGLEEPAPATPAQAGRPLSWSSFSEIPNILVARLRLAK